MAKQHTSTFGWRGEAIPAAIETIQCIKGIAKELRQRETTSEALLWEALRNRRCEGLKFRRQHPFGPFVLDFFCVEKLLGIEIDGPVHAGQAERDKERQGIIEAAGCTILRFSSSQVETDINSVLAAIRGWICSPLPPAASPQVKGEN